MPAVTRMPWYNIHEYSRVWTVLNTGIYVRTWAITRVDLEVRAGEWESTKITLNEV